MSEPLPSRPLVPPFLLHGFADAAGQLMAERRDRTRRRLVTVDAVLAELGTYAVPPERAGARELAALLAEAEAAAATAVGAMLAGTFPPPPASRAALALLVALQLLVAPRHRATAARAAELVAHLIAARLDALEAAARGEDGEDEETAEDAEAAAADETDEEADEGEDGDDDGGAEDGETEPGDGEAAAAPLATSPPPVAGPGDPVARGRAAGRPAPERAGGDLVLRTGRRRSEHSLASAVALAHHVAARTWQLVRFAHPVLLTSDTPVVLWAPSATAKPYHAGLGAADEIRVPLDSRHALIVARRARAGEIVRDLEERHARALNRTVAEAASEWIYYHPASDPLEGVALASSP